jgi:PI-3-kinase-related kinase SMG-1
MKCLNPIHHDNSIWNTALRYTSHLAGTSISQQNHTPSLLLEAYRLARKHNNLKLARSLIQRHILGLVQNNSNEMGLSGAVENMHSSISLSPQEKFHVMRELSKLYACLGQTSEAVDSLTTSISTFCESQAKTRDSGPGQRQLPGNELTGRGLLTLVKWLQSDTRLLGTLWHPEFETGKKLESLLTQEMECRRLRLGLYQNTDAIESSDLFQPDSSVARFDKHEYGIGQLLHLATIHCPNLAKAWWLLAGWSYRIGRKNLEALSSTGTAELLQHEQKEVDRILGHLVLSEERIGILKVLGQVHIADDSTDEDLKDKEQLKSLDMEEDTKSVKGQLLSVCPSLESLPSLDPLLAIWHGVRKRMFMHYQLSARAYFHFLKLSGEQAGSSPGLDDMNVTASLRLLRLLVKYAGELKSELENGFAATPTKPWKGIIPQLFSRLNHPEANVRQSVSDLLCRVGQDSPHYIIYPAIVGASKGAEKKSSFSGILGGHGGDEKETEESYSSSNIESNNMLGDQYSPPDDTLQGNMDEPVETSSMELSNLDKCLSVIVDSLTQKNPEMVKAVRDLVAELCRITLLWDEMWLAALMQRQGEVHRRLMQIEAELKRTLSIPNHLLTPEAKDAIMKQKYVATMKPLLWVLEYLAAVTAQPPETLNERQFQVEYGDLISIAIQKLQNPSNYKVSHNVWDPFKQLQQMLMHRAQKRMQSPLSLNEISPHLAAIQSSCISMPGHTQQDEVSQECMPQFLLTVDG